MQGKGKDVDVTSSNTASLGFWGGTRVTFHFLHAYIVAQQNQFDSPEKQALIYNQTKGNGKDFLVIAIGETLCEGKKVDLQTYLTLT